MDSVFMQCAILESRKTTRSDDVPVGAIVVYHGKIIARAHNLKEKKNCSNYHAEMIAIEKASKVLGTWRLNGCDIYVTLEPCAMCTGALINARVDNIYFGAFDHEAGCCGSKINLISELSRKINIEGGILEDVCSEMLSNYFKEKRSKQ